MTEDEKTIKAWGYEKMMSVLYESAHSSPWKDVTFDDYDIVNCIRLIAPDYWESIKEKVKMEKEQEESNEV